MMIVWTEPSDIRGRWLDNKPLPKDETLNNFIADVERQYRNYYPKIQDRIDNGSLDLDYVKQVVSTIIIEFLQTGGAPYQQETQQYTGVASRSVSYAVNRARYNLRLTDDDFEMLAPEGLNQGFAVVKFVKGK